MAIAGMLNRAQAPASSSGIAAPSRKENAERAWRSTNIFTTEAQRHRERLFHRRDAEARRETQSQIRERGGGRGYGVFSVSLCLCGEFRFPLSHNFPPQTTLSARNR